MKHGILISAVVISVVLNLVLPRLAMRFGDIGHEHINPDDGAISRINKNTDFRIKAQRTLWSIWIALLGIIGKMIFWD